jgi:HSP20 family protein
VPAPFSGNGFLSPKVNVAETPTGLEVTAELPGIDQKDIELDLSDGVLTIKAEHKSEKEEKDEKKHYHLVERAYGTYLRRFSLPFDPDEDKVTANFDKGVLKIAIPKSADNVKQSRKIEVKAA